MITVSGLEPKPYHITAEGVAALSKQLEAAKRKRLQITQEMRDGDPSSSLANALEDSALTVSHSQVDEVDSQIVLLERIITLAKVIQKPNTNHQVQIGSQVSVTVNDAKHHYVIVGPIEANPALGKISHESPFGQSLLGKKLNDQVEIVSPKMQRIIATITGIGPHAEKTDLPYAM